MDNKERHTNAELTFRAGNEYKSPVKHNNLRRKTGHDYTAPSVYLITVTTIDRKPLFGSLDGGIDDARIKPTELGLAVISAFRDIENNVRQKTGCFVQILQYQLMPDHFHGILHVHDQLPASYPLGKIIGAWKGECSRAYWQTLPPSSTSPVSSPPSVASFPASVVSPKRSPLFSPGFNDRPLNGYGQLQGWIHYLHDNPRRLAIKRANPELFRIHQKRSVGGITCTALGNIFLADYPRRKALQCSRKLTPEQIETLKEECLSEAANGTVFVSAAISEGEKQICQALRIAGLPLIVLLEHGFPAPDSPQYPYYKPQGVYFESCAAGKLLLLEPDAELFELDDVARQITSKAGNIPHSSLRYRFLALNIFAERICAHQ